MQTYTLVPHPSTPPDAPINLRVDIYQKRGNDALIEFIIAADAMLCLPGSATPARCDRLWTTTCCELFVSSPERAGYWEFNFSPSGQWAAYAFSTYRVLLGNHEIDVAPHIECRVAGGAVRVEIEVDLGGLPPGPLNMGLAAVIEEASGTKSYWALAHPPGAPDFHDPACFTARLGPAAGAW